LQIGSLGQKYQGMTYGTRSKPRWDGKKKAFWKTKGDEETPSP
jgi:hypothetical protein